MTTRSSGATIASDDTASLALGLESLNDAVKRAETIDGVLGDIKKLARDAQAPDADLTAINANYAARVAQLTDLSRTPARSATAATPWRSTTC